MRPISGLLRIWRDHLDIFILAVVAFSTWYNYTGWEAFLAEPNEIEKAEIRAHLWRVYQIAIAGILWAYSWTRLRFQNWPSITLWAVFGVNFLGTLMGFNLSYKSWPEVLLSICCIGLAFYLAQNTQRLINYLKKKVRGTN